MKAPSEEIYSISTICDCPLMLNSQAVLLTVCEIFTAIELENRYFRQLQQHCDCRPHSGETPCNINVICTPSKSAFNALQYCRYLHVFNRYCISNLRHRAKFDFMAVHFKVIQGHRSCCQSKAHMQLSIVISSNYGVSAIVFEILTNKAIEKLLVSPPSLFCCPSSGNPL